MHHFKPFLLKEFQGDKLFELTQNYFEFIQNSYSENVNYPFYLIKLLFAHSQVTDLAIDSVLILSTSATHLFTFNIHLLIKKCYQLKRFNESEMI